MNGEIVKQAELISRFVKIEDRVTAIENQKVENGKTDLNYGWRIKIVEDSLKELIEVKKTEQKRNQARSWDVWKIVLAVVITSALTFVIGKLL